MNTPILAPDTGSSVVRFSLWYVDPGEWIFEGDRVAEVLIPGVTIDVLSPVRGRLRERLVGPGDRLQPGQILGTIESEL